MSAVYLFAAGKLSLIMRLLVKQYVNMLLMTT